MRRGTLPKLIAIDGGIYIVFSQSKSEKKYLYTIDALDKFIKEINKCSYVQGTKIRWGLELSHKVLEMPKSNQFSLEFNLTYT